MGALQNLIKKMRRQKEAKEGYEGEQRIIERYEEKKKSANERELDGYLNEIRETRIKQRIDGFRKQKQKELWSGKKGNPAYVKNVIAGQKAIFKNHKKIFLGKDAITNQKNIFVK